MGKRKERGEVSRKKKPTKDFLSAQKLKSREFVDFNVWIQREAALLELNKHNPNPMKESGIIDVSIWIQREAAALELNKHNPNPTKESRVIISEPVVFDKSSEASRMKKYAISALAKGPSKQDFELVQIGPLAVGDLSRRHRILHLNFKAKRLSGSGEGDAVVLTYFCELTETIHSDHVSVLSCIYLGPSHLLPEKADTRGCLYCSSCNIHHPEYRYSFQNGGKPYVKTLTSKIKAIDTYLRLRKHKTKAAFIQRFPDPGLEYFGETTQVLIDRYPSVALRIYNRKQGSNFELVKIGKHGVIHNKFGFVFHLNFEARNKDDVDDAVQTFFAQVIQKAHYFLVDFCSCLGPTYFLPDEADLQGCCNCKSKAGVHHPPGPGYLIGREIDLTMVRRGGF